MSRLLKNKLFLALLIGCGVVSLAVSSLTFAATHIQASICSAFTAPAIMEPASGLKTEADSIVVKGTGDPDMPVSIIENGSSVASVIVASDGVYAVSVPLVVGDNTLVAREADNCTTLNSAGVTVTRATAQVPPGAETPPESSFDNPPVLETRQPPQGSPLTPHQSTQHPATSGFPAPTIQHPVNGEKFIAERIWVSGTAQAGSTVIIYVNDFEAVRMVAADDGTYGAKVTLKQGANVIQVLSVKDGESAMSGKVTVRFTKPSVKPQPYSFLYSLILPSVATSIFTVTLVWHIYKRRGKVG